MVAEETPHAGIGIAHILKIDGTVGIAERKLLVLAIEKTFLSGKRDYILGIETFHLGAMQMLETATTETPIAALPLQRELADATKIGVGTDTIVWHP
jgi:hypothetical protein